MQKEVKASETLATVLALLCGGLMFCANLLICISTQIATENNQNMAIVSGISNGNIPLGLLGSFLLYKETLSKRQVSGSLICMIGTLTLSLSVFVVPQAVIQTGAALVSQT